MGIVEDFIPKVAFYLLGSGKKGFGGNWQGENLFPQKFQRS
jgi:hypothetical protein